MAADVVVCDMLCLLRHKLGCMPAKVIKSVLSDFYSTGAISGAKNQLMDYISRLETDAILPHVPKRRDGDNRIAHEIDDIYSRCSLCWMNKNS